MLLCMCVCVCVVNGTSEEVFRCRAVVTPGSASLRKAVLPKMPWRLELKV